MNIVIIGGGPAGIEAALTASQMSHRVTLITNSEVGEWKSTLPNLLLYHVDDIVDQRTFSLPHLNNQRKMWQQSITKKLHKAGVHLLYGTATFTAENSIKVTSKNDNDINLIADKVIVATGARPFFPAKMIPDAKRVFSYENLHKLNTIPSSVIVIGESPIGYEMVHLFQQLGSKVKWLLPPDEKTLFDRDIEAYLHKLFLKNNVEFIRGPFVKKLINQGDHITAVRRDDQQITADMAFITLGFKQNLDQLNVSAADIKLQTNGTIKVNDFFQTENPNVYVVGDANRPLSVVYAQASGRVATLHACDHQVVPVKPQLLPLSFNENPQVSTVGYIDSTDPTIREVTIPYDDMQFRAYMTDEKEGFLKLAFDSTGTIVGGTCIGSQAKDIISIVTFMIKMNIKAEDVQSFFSSHPSAMDLPFTLIRNEFKSV